MSLSYNDHYDNHAEGWGVFSTGLQDAVHNPYELQRIDEDGKFVDDGEAIRFVCYKALQDVYGRHARAIKFLVEESPNEIDSVVRNEIGTNNLDNLLNALNVTL